MSSGSAFHKVDPVEVNAREPYVRVVLFGTLSRFLEAERRERVCVYGVSSSVMYSGARLFIALYVNNSVLYIILLSTGSQ